MNELVEWLRALIAWIREQLDEDERVANNARGILGVTNAWWKWEDLKQRFPDITRADAMQIARHGWDRVLREVEAKREMLTEHAPQLQTVEWDHDQNGKGEALCCPRCQNAEHSEWNPPVGRARGLPEGFVTPYVLAPCRTLRLLALPYSDRPGYREEWRP